MQVGRPAQASISQLMLLQFYLDPFIVQWTLIKTICKSELDFSAFLLIQQIVD